MIKIKKFIFGLAVSGVGLFSLAGTAPAQFITWEDSVNLFMGETSQEFVNTTGNVAAALNATNLSDPNAVTVVVDPLVDVINVNPVVNGVAFTGADADVPVTGAGGESITLNGGINNFQSFGDGEFTSDLEIFNLIRGGNFQVDSVTLGGLEIGQEYLVQVFTNDPRGNRTFLFVTGFGDGSGSVAPVGFSDLNNSPLNDEFGMIVPPDITLGETDAGDSIIGTFTPDTDTLTFNVFGSNAVDAETGEPIFNAGDGRAQINAIQLRRVEEVLVSAGDFNGDGVVDCTDLDGYVGNIGAAATGALSTLDIDLDGAISIDDADLLVTTLVVTMPNGVTGTVRGDLNCDGSVSVLGDAFVLIGNLGGAVTTYVQGDVNFDGTVSVLGDAFVLIGALGFNNSP